MNVEQAITHLRYRNVTNKERFTEAIDVLENEINRQQAEIERLRNALMGECMLTKCSRENEIKSEAIKEFAERLKNEFEISSAYSSAYIECKIDNLVKEMVGDTK